MTGDIAPHGGGHSRLARATRLALSAITLGAAVTMVVMLQQVRHLEATLAALWIAPATGHRSMLWADSFLLHLSDTQIIAFRITVECTIVILAAPILALGAVTLAFTRVGIARWASAVALGLVTVIIVNQLRLGLIAAATLTWGLRPGYEISHTFVGSALALIGFAGAIALMLIVMSRGRRRLGRISGRRAAH